MRVWCRRQSSRTFGQSSCSFSPHALVITVGRPGPQTHTQRDKIGKQAGAVSSCANLGLALVCLFWLCHGLGSHSVLGPATHDTMRTDELRVAENMQEFSLNCVGTPLFDCFFIPNVFLKFIQGDKGLCYLWNQVGIGSHR